MPLITRFLYRSRRKGRAWPQYSSDRIELLSPEQFIELYRTAPRTIKTAHVVPGELGSSDFGSIVVVRKVSAVR